MLAVGPYDGRKARRKRCDACVKRKIRCHDGVPCANCRQAGRTCTIPAKATVFMPVFVGETAIIRADQISAVSRANTSSVPVPPSIPSKGVDVDLPYFFTTFMPMNVIIGRKVPIAQEVLTVAEASPACRDAIQAISMLHRGQQHRQSKPRTRGMLVPSKVEALQAYGQSVRSMQKRIASMITLSDPTVLWTTFFLGLFELMRDETGVNWLSHFLYGTCTMLRLQRPDHLLGSDAQSQQRRTFFLATRIFEIARSLIYSSHTFLSQPEWISALARLWQDEGVALWHPKEALFDLLPQVSDLSIRAIEFCERATQLSPEVQHAMSVFLADDGLLLQERLQQWLVETAAWERVTYGRNNEASKLDTELLIGYIYYHAISIYLSGTYDYHVHWTWSDALCAPILSRSQIDQHVFAILRLSQALLAQGISGVLLFFPLRVAGARAADASSRSEIMNLLHTTAMRGFAVAEAFKIDLSELWANKSL